MSHGVRSTCHVEANITRVLLGSTDKSAAPVLSFTCRMFFQVLPPSCERKTPRSGFAPYGWPIAATYTRSGFFGSTHTLPIWLLSRSPTFCHVLPASVDL